jgi:hypothetical protein
VGACTLLGPEGPGAGLFSVSSGLIPDAGVAGWLGWVPPVL